MNKLSLQKRAQILGLLVEGTSMRAVTRLVGRSINTVTKFLEDVGAYCPAYQDALFAILSTESSTRNPGALKLGQFDC